MPKTFVVFCGEDRRFRIPLKRDGIDEALGSNPAIKLTIDGIATLTVAAGTIEVSDPLVNEAIATLAAAKTASKEPGVYPAQCWVTLDTDDAQLVWEGEIALKKRLVDVP